MMGFHLGEGGEQETFMFPSLPSPPPQEYQWLIKFQFVVPPNSVILHYCPPPENYSTCPTHFIACTSCTSLSHVHIIPPLHVGRTTSKKNI